MATQRASCVYDRPRVAECYHKVGPKPHDAGRCGVRGWLETLGGLPRAAERQIICTRKPVIRGIPVYAILTDYVARDGLLPTGQMPDADRQQLKLWQRARRNQTETKPLQSRISTPLRRSRAADKDLIIMSTIRRLCLAAAFFALAAGLAMAPIAEALAKSCGQLLNTEIAQSGTGQFTTSSTIFANVVGSNVSFNVAGASPSCVIVSFSAQAFAQNRAGLFVRALLDNNVESVDGVSFS